MSATDRNSTSAEGRTKFTLGASERARAPLGPTSRCRPAGRRRRLPGATDHSPRPARLRAGCSVPTARPSGRVFGMHVAHHGDGCGELGWQRRENPRQSVQTSEGGRDAESSAQGADVDAALGRRPHAFPVDDRLAACVRWRTYATMIPDAYAIVHSGTPMLTSGSVGVRLYESRMVRDLRKVAPS